MSVKQPRNVVSKCSATYCACIWSTDPLWAVWKMWTITLRAIAGGLLGDKHVSLEYYYIDCCICIGHAPITDIYMISYFSFLFFFFKKI